MEQITIKAYAKINLALDVLRKRPDGYHDLKMIMQTVDIFDELTFRKRNDREIYIKIAQPESETDAAGAYGNEEPDNYTNLKADAASGKAAEETVPCDERNLIYRAARAVMERYAQCGGADVTLLKNIPVAAGMAGGSTDAAAAIRAMNTLYDLHMDMNAMKEIAVKIGADVPYCLIGGTVLCEGIGDIMTPLAPAPQTHLVVVKPDISVSTAAVYGRLDASDVRRHPDVDGMKEAIAAQDAAGVAARLGNVLESVTAAEYPVIDRIKNILIQCGAGGALMSGSGPTVFGMFESKEGQRGACEMLCETEGIERIYLCNFVNDIRQQA